MTDQDEIKALRADLHVLPAVSEDQTRHEFSAEQRIRHDVEFLSANMPFALEEELVQARLELTRLQGENAAYRAMLQTPLGESLKAHIELVALRSAVKPVVEQMQGYKRSGADSRWALEHWISTLAVIVTPE